MHSHSPNSWRWLCTWLVLLVVQHAAAQDTATLSADAVAAGFTFKMTATGFRNTNFEQLAGAVTYTGTDGKPKIMVDGIPSGDIYVLDDVDGQTPPAGQTVFQPVSNSGTSGAQALAVLGGDVYLADALNFQILQLSLDGVVNPTPLVNFLPIRPTALAVNARNNHLIVCGGGQVLDIDPTFASFTQYTVLIPDWGTGGVAFSEDYTTLFVEGGVWGMPVVRRYTISLDGLTATYDTSHPDLKGNEQMFGLVVGTGCLSPSLFMSAASGFYQISTTNTLKNIIEANGAGFIARDEMDGCLLFTSDQLYRLCPPTCGGFVGITPVAINACATNNGGCGLNMDCANTITGAPQCTCTTGYISNAPTTNDCVAVDLSGTWTDPTMMDVIITIAQTGLTFTATVSGTGASSNGWQSATAQILAAGAISIQFDTVPGVSVDGQIFNAQQKLINFPSIQASWTRRSMVGVACSSNGDCTSNNCVNGVCKPSTVNLPCSVNSDCTSGNCIDGVCTGNGYGGKCSQPSDCLSNILCQAGKCQGVNSCFTLNGGCNSDATCTATGSNKRKCKCNEGYSGSGQGTKGCTGPCRGNPAAKHGGTLSCDTTTSGYVVDGTVCNLVCPAGYFARGSFKCDDGHWKDKDPLCSAATCPAPDLSKVAHSTAGTCTGKRTYHDCNLGCEAGFLPAGNTHAICLGTTGSHSAYSFTPFACNDIDECNYLPRKCGDGWQCTNSVGSYSCIPLAPRMAYKSEREVGLRWTRLGDTPKVSSLTLQVSTSAGVKKNVKIDGAEWADSVRVSDLTVGQTYTFTLVAVLSTGTATGLPLTVTL